MLLQTILNKIQKFKGYVYGKVRESRWGDDQTLEIEIHSRKGSRGICSACGKAGPSYDRGDLRRFEFIPMWGYRVFFLYRMRRIQCPTCGVKVERVPWAEGKSELTREYQWFLAGWAKRMSWEDVKKSFKTSWHHVYGSVQMAVEWGLHHRDLEGIWAIGIDEIQIWLGHKYITLVYQIDAGCRRLLWIGKERKRETLEKFFEWFGERKAAQLKFVCSDMWKPYLTVVKQKAKQAIHILDRFHIVAHQNKSIDAVRAQEAQELKRKGKGEWLKRSRWLFLKRAENLNEPQSVRLAEIVRHNLRTVRAYLLKEEFQQFWEYESVISAGLFLDEWCTKVMRSRIAPMKKVAKMLRTHRELILNWFRGEKQFSSGVVEGLNNKAKSIVKRAYGFKTYEALEVALLHTLGNLPEPKFTHRFF